VDTFDAIIARAEIRWQLLDDKTKIEYLDGVIVALTVASKHPPITDPDKALDEIITTMEGLGLNAAVSELAFWHVAVLGQR